MLGSGEDNYMGPREVNLKFIRNVEMQIQIQLAWLSIRCWSAACYGVRPWWGWGGGYGSLGGW